MSQWHVGFDSALSARQALIRREFDRDMRRIDIAWAIFGLTLLSICYLAGWL